MFGSIGDSLARLEDHLRLIPASEQPEVVRTDEVAQQSRKPVQLAGVVVGCPVRQPVADQADGILRRIAIVARELGLNDRQIDEAPSDLEARVAIEHLSQSLVQR